MSKIKNQLLPLILSVLILSFLTAYWIFAWDEPGSSPPAGNVATPINTGSTAQTKTGALTVTILTTSGGVLYLDDSIEGNLERVDKIIGTGDLFLLSNVAEDGPIEIGGSQLNFYSNGLKWQIDSTGTLTTGSVPWTRLTSFPSDCAAGEYASGIGSTLTCSAPAGGIQGGGTVNYLSKFTDTGTIGNSQVFDDGTGVGIGTVTPAQKLEVVDGGYVIFHEGFWGSATGDPEGVDIWGLSSTYYPSHGTAGNRYGIKWDNTDDRITFVGAGTTRAYIDLNDGNSYVGGDLTVDGELKGITKLSFDQGTNFSIDTNTNGLIFDGGDGTADFLIYDNSIYSDTLRLGYSGSANITTYDTNESLTIDPNGTGNVIFQGNVGIGDTTPDYKLDVAGSVGLDGDLTVGGGDIFGKNSEWIDIGDAETNSVQISNHLIIGANDTIDDDTTIGGDADDWISFSGYIEMRSNTDNYGIVLRDKDTTSYLGLTQVGGYSYLADSDSYSNYFLRGNADDVHIKDDLTVGDDITVTGNVVATSNALSSCAWECAGGVGEAGEFSNICNSGKVAAGIRIQKQYWFPIFFVYNVCVYCCEL